MKVTRRVRPVCIRGASSVADCCCASLSLAVASCKSSASSGSSGHGTLINPMHDERRSALSTSAFSCRNTTFCQYSPEARSLSTCCYPQRGDPLWHRSQLVKLGCLNVQAEASMLQRRSHKRAGLLLKKHSRIVMGHNLTNQVGRQPLRSYGGRSACGRPGHNTALVTRRWLNIPFALRSRWGSHAVSRTLFWQSSHRRNNIFLWRQPIYILSKNLNPPLAAVI